MFPEIDKETAIAKFQNLDMDKKTAAIIDLILYTFSDAHVKRVVVVVVSRSKPADLPMIEVAARIFGAAMS